jgi:hypothetical protein
MHAPYGKPLKPDFAFRAISGAYGIPRVPASSELRTETLHQLRRSLGSIAHLAVTAAFVSEGSSRMVQVRLRATETDIAPEELKADIRLLWQRDVARSSNAVFGFLDTAAGLEFQFTLFCASGEYVTGHVAIELFRSLV